MARNTFKYYTAPNGATFSEPCNLADHWERGLAQAYNLRQLARFVVEVATQPTVAISSSVATLNDLTAVLYTYNLTRVQMAIVDDFEEALYMMTWDDDSQWIDQCMDNAMRAIDDMKEQERLNRWHRLGLD